MKRQKRWSEELSSIIKMYDLYGRSFTKGVALYYALKDKRLDEDLEDEADYELHNYLGEDFFRTLDERQCCTDTSVLVHIIDLSVLDTIARNLCVEE